MDFLESYSRGRLEGRTPPRLPASAPRRRNSFPPIQQIPQEEAPPSTALAAAPKPSTPLSALFPNPVREAGATRGGGGGAPSLSPAPRFAPSFSSTLEEGQEQEQEQEQEGRKPASEGEGRLSLEPMSQNQVKGQVEGAGAGAETGCRADSRECLPEEVAGEIVAAAAASDRDGDGAGSTIDVPPASATADDGGAGGAGGACGTASGSGAGCKQTYTYSTPGATEGADEAKRAPVEDAGVAPQKKAEANSSPPVKPPPPAF